jgi:mono/diheme cytochrome c family protein
MSKRILVVVGALTISASVAAFQEKPQIQRKPISPTSVGDAKAMFQTYCAACHGKEGKGDGPAATALKKAPADLTKLSARNGGQFPENRVSRYIQGLDQLAAHGSRDMPVWGDLFKSLGSSGTVILRVANLTDYVKSLQQ